MRNNKGRDYGAVSVVLDEAADDSPRRGRDGRKAREGRDAPQSFVDCRLQATTTKSRTAETSQNAAIIVARVLSKYALYFDEAELSTKAANRANLAL